MKKLSINVIAEIVEGATFNLDLNNEAEGMYLVQVSDGVNVYVQHQIGRAHV